jgi:hypothetical protein
MLHTFVETPAMRELFDRTIRHSPTGRFDASGLVAPAGRHQMTVFKATDYLVRNLVRRMAVEAGAELRPGMMPVETSLRKAFSIHRLAPLAKEWWSDLVDAKTVMKEFAEGGQVSRESLINACQAMGNLEIRLRVGDPKFDPVRLDRSVTQELLAIWDNLDAQEMLVPRSLVVLHPHLARAGIIPASTANLLVDGTLIDVKTVVTPNVERVFLRQLVGKAAQAQLGGVLPKGSAP